MEKGRHIGLWQLRPLGHVMVIDVDGIEMQQADGESHKRVNFNNLSVH
jgi:hypothetical protein